MNRQILRCLIIAAALLAVILIGLSIGPVPISLLEMSATDKEIVFDLRLPRVLSAFLVGGGLALAGAIFQGLFRNPIADSYLLGVSSGASLGAAAAIVFRLASPLASFAAVSVFAFVGSIGALALVRYYSRKQSIFLFIGAGFLGNTLLELYHAEPMANSGVRYV